MNLFKECFNEYMECGVNISNFENIEKFTHSLFALFALSAQQGRWILQFPGFRVDKFWRFGVFRIDELRDE